jgi:hypothetical protein
MRDRVAVLARRGADSEEGAEAMTDEERQLIREVGRDLDLCFDQGSREYASNEPSRLFHYTATEGLVGIITNKAFFLSDMMASTDQTEIRYGFDIVQQVLKESESDDLVNLLRVGYELKDFGLGEEMWVYAVCFCDEDDALTQWRGYSPAGGFAIGVDFKVLKQEAAERDGFDLKRMVYALDGQRDIVRRIINCGKTLFPKVRAAANGRQDTQLLKDFATAVALRLFKSSLLFKHKAFSSEREWRFFTVETDETMRHSPSRFRARGNTITPYIELAFASKPFLIDQIRCSPGVWSRSALYGVNRLAKSLGDHVQVAQSELPL